MTKSIIALQFMPLVGALLLLLIPKKKADIAGVFALLFALAEAAFALRYLSSGVTLTWPVAFGVTMAFSFDKLAAITIIVISVAVAIASLYSLTLKQDTARSSSFYSLMLMTLFGTVGVALAQDLIQFYVFWEAMLIPAWVLVLYWNEQPLKAKYTGLKFFVITHIGAVLMLSSILWIYSLTGTTNMTALASILPTLALKTLIIMSVLFLMGFIVKLAIFPFHTWLPDSYTTSSMPVTLILVGVMAPIGIYGMARFVPFFPATAMGYLSQPMMIAALVTMFYGGFMALAEKNVKKIVAYSSMSQMGYVLLGFATLVPAGMAGSVFSIINQAATKLTLFMCLGVIAEHSGTYNIDDMGGWAKKLPFAAIAAVIAVLSLVGAPPLLGFWPEFLIFQGAYTYGNYYIASLGLIATVLSAAYGLRLIKLVFFGPLSGKHTDAIISPRWSSSLAIFSTMLVLVVLGVYPAGAFIVVKQAVSSLGYFFGG